MKTAICLRSRFPLLATGIALLAAFTLPAPAGTTRIVERVEVDRIFSGLTVGFQSLTDEANNRQYVAYYDANRDMAVASRSLGSRQWTKRVLPTRVGWDSHNYVTLALDRDGQLHVTGNMHCAPLIYFRTTTPGDVMSLRPVARMTGAREMRVTYPQFIKGSGDELIFTYRDGESGNGDTLYNRYDEKSRRWTRLTDKPLFDGQGLMNAYPVGPVRGPDGLWHLTWVWRGTPDAGSNHDLSYARSRDLVHWETADGKSLSLPISLKTPGSVIDPVPPGGAIINGTGRIGFDDKGRTVISYHKYDDKGATQIYFARDEGGVWKITCLTDWNYRWSPGGGGTISFDVSCSELRHDPRVGYYIGLENKVEGSGTWRIDPTTLKLGEKLRNDELPTYVPPELLRRTGEDPRLTVRMPSEPSTTHPGRRYLLRRESLPFNRDRPPEPPVPAPGPLEIITVETTSG
ncbi:hypothetical protein OPIT5_04485 [Opitutaceae bacterium TAV5]|nr:hypothetical protein OPIT5_04485 [Opitutaceae bacterium TAV5]